jgi:hypothetical protein
MRAGDKIINRSRAELPGRERCGSGEYDPIGGITVGYRAGDLPPQSPGIRERRRDAAAVVHRGQWGRHR